MDVCTGSETGIQRRASNELTQLLADFNLMDLGGHDGVRLSRRTAPSPTTPPSEISYLITITTSLADEKINSL